MSAERSKDKIEKIAPLKSSLFARHVYAVQRYVEFTAPRYEPLMKAGISVHPVCCFGSLESADVVTVGLNPSVSEFDKPRWPDVIDHMTLAGRCANYFSKGAKPPFHEWFAPWITGLSHLGYGYENGSAVHLDLTPRATRFVSQLKEAQEQLLFLEMVERDL